MAKNTKVIEILNKAVAMEMTATNQYMYFHFRCDDYGFEPLAKLFKRIAIVEMIHIERLAERIFFLGGDVKMILADPVEQIADAKAMIAKAEQLEIDTVKAYNQFSKECSEELDMASKRLLEELLEEEELHQDTFSIEEDSIKRSEKEYLALQAFQHSKAVAKKD